MWRQNKKNIIKFANKRKYYLKYEENKFAIGVLAY